MENLSLIVGLGNPGRQYARTRHNAGFMALDRLGSRWRAEWTKERRFKAKLARLDRNGKRVCLCEPDTFMNASGAAVGPLAAYYQVAPKQLLVVLDDADLPLGELRLRPRGSSGGHHGLESIQQHLGTQDFARLRVGIGRDPADARQISGYVLSEFSRGESELVEKVLLRACDQIECWLDHGNMRAMNDYNGLVAV